MTALALNITRAGLARFAAAQLGDDIDLTIASVGLTDALFVPAPTLTALPGEHTRLAMVSGAVVDASVVHLTMRDNPGASYAVRGFGLFLADGTLFAVYWQADRIVEKSAKTGLYLAIDVAFPLAGIDQLTFGDTNFLNPPATRLEKGVAMLATQADVEAGDNDDRIVTPRLLSALLTRMFPAGTITLFYGTVPPAGWAICNGQEVDRADGTGKITTPDLRGRVAIGVSNEYALGAVLGAASHALTTSRAADHAHGAATTIAQRATGVTANVSTRDVDAGSSANNLVSGVSLIDPGHTHDAATTIDPAGAHSHDVTVDVIQPSLALHYIMRV